MHFAPDSFLMVQQQQQQRVVLNNNCSRHICGFVKIEFAGNTIQLWIVASSQLPVLLILCSFCFIFLLFSLLLLWQIYNTNCGDIVPTHGNGARKWRPRKIRISFDCSKSREARFGGALCVAFFACFLHVCFFFFLVFYCSFC